MEAVQDWKGRATLVDLLDRVFDKGVVIQADIIISVSGIPLIGVNLRAALAGMETMLEYGMMQDMDAKTRMWEAQHRKNKQVPLSQGEEVVLDTFGSYYYSRGIYSAWKSGRFYLTGARLLLYQQEPTGVVFETPLDGIRAIAVRKERSFTGKDRDIIYLYLTGERVVRLSVLDTEQFKQKLESQVERTGGTLDSRLPVEELDQRASRFLMQGEKVTCKGKMWHLVRDKSVLGDTWKPGHLYLTNQRVCWWYEFERRILFDVPIGEINASVEEVRDLSAVLKHKQVLDVIYSNNGSKKVASFSGKETGQWQAALNRAVAKQDSSEIEEEKESCPQCGEEHLEVTLLKKGCPGCGWRSPRLKKEIAEVLRV